MKVHPGKDSLFRVVTVRTQHGTVQRPIVKLVVLPLLQEDDTMVSGKVTT